MTDRELLELAAKAAGVEHVTPAMVELGQWNPLIYDGDALRLAVKLRLQIQIVGLMDDEVMVYALEHEDVEPWEKIGKDPYAATRRAIVRAAAAIGRSME